MNEGRGSLALFLALILFVFSCKSNEPENKLLPGTYDRKMTVDGWQRTYRLHVPVGYTGDLPLPLVIALHGGGGTGPEMEQLTRFSILADEETFLVTYPDGALDNHWADGRGTTQPELQGVNDINFIKALIEQISEDANIDSHKVYACGFSNGSIMTNLLGCDLSTKLAAIGGVSGQLAENASSRVPSNPIGVIYFHGTADPVVPYAGGIVLGPNNGRVLSVSDLMTFWVNSNQTSTTPAVSLMPDIDPNDGTRVIHFAFFNGQQGTEVHLYRVENGGHTWPGSNQPGNVTHDVDATRLIWDFFKTQSR